MRPTQNLRSSARQYDATSGSGQDGTRSKRPRSQFQFAGDAEPDALASFGREFPGSLRGSQILRPLLPRSAPHDATGAIARRARGSIARHAGERLVPAILDPFGHIAVNMEKPERIGLAILDWH